MLMHIVFYRKGLSNMVPISVEKFADMVMKNNKGYNRKELIELWNLRWKRKSMVPSA